MRRTPIVATASLACAIVFLAGWEAVHGEDKEKKTVSKKDIKQLMEKAHKGDKSPLANLGKELKAENPDWAQVNKDTRVLTDMADVLRANMPYVASGYHNSAHALDKAARANDQKAATAALTGLQKSCTSCHYYGGPASGLK